ncbi:MAG TPA: aminopeptidase [Lachnoclostridium sp.]|jgi:aspartyl aminopeptidase|uniref:aminopeptidase n=1 Tax=Lacrimispora sp. TaxID=2719234 RepID=UPI000ECD057E|nr:aminopeptidase [Lacrimispora sp.]HCD44043.1 aminopeptidase [Lachnoclostridium sp.]
MEKTRGQQLQEELTFKFPHIAKEAPYQREEAEMFCEGYKRFLDNGKTERECVREAVAMLEMQGYRPFDAGRSYKAGDKVYYVNRGKAIIATTFGKAGMEQGLRINGAHIDSPRLDLKPNPVFEKNDLAYFKTHYYGGIRKYQWGTVPLAIHGVIIKKNGEVVELNIGEKEGDPVFCVTDLLPHLAGEQNDRKLRDGLKGEELNVLISSIPFIDEAELKEPVKLLALKLLNDRYGITEADFFRAEIELVPAQKACDVGLDHSLIGAYGQDDRVCAYTALMAEIDANMPEYTTVTVLADKEEVGSEGNTGLDSDFVLHYIQDLAAMAQLDVRKVLRNSICLSSDVNAAYDPTFAQVYEDRNSCFLNKGCVLTKYTGVRGKSGSNDASAELMAKIIAMMEQEGIYWQIGELGAVDQGGGGTIAKYVAHMNVDVVDLGVPILSMHSPFELSSKLDVYNTYKAFRAFYK